jgi:hypothetical protein
MPDWGQFGSDLLSMILRSSANGALPDVLGGAAKGAQSQKNIGDYLNLAKGNEELNRNKFAVEAPGTRAGTALHSALGAALTPTHVSWGGPGSGLRGEMPVYSGGAHDALASLKGNPDIQGLLSTIQKDMLAQQQKGGATGGNADAAMPDYLKDIGQSSLLDKILGGSALGTSLLGALGKGGGNPSGGNPSGASMNLGDLFKSLFGGGSPPTGDPYGSTPWGSGGPSISHTPDPFGFDPNDPLGGGVDYSQLPGFGTPLGPAPHQVGGSNDEPWDPTQWAPLGHE